MSVQRSSVLLCVLALATLSVAQEIPFHTLRAVWGDTTLSIRQRVPALAQWLDTDSTMTVQQAVRIAVGEPMDTSRMVYVRQTGLATLARSSAYGHGRQFSKAIATAKDALRIAQRAGNVQDIALIHTYLDRQLNEIGAHAEALEHQLAALRGYEQVRDTFGQINANNALAFAFSTQGITDRAIAYYARNLALARHRRPKEEVDAMLRIADLCRDMGDPRTAMSWLDSATQVVQHEGGADPDRMINWMRGDMMLDNGDCAGALAEFQVSLAAIDAEPFNPAGKSWMRSRIAMALACAKDFRAAVDWASAGLAIAEEHHLRKEEMDNLYPLAEAYEGLGNTRESLRYYKRYHALMDSVINTESARSLSDAALTQDFEKQQFADSLATAAQRTQDRLVAEQQVQRQRTQRNVLLFFGAFALFFAVVDLRRRRRIKAEHARSEALLLNILPSEVAAELKAKGHADAKHFDNVTILFTDFKGFTEASERMSPQELVEELNSCFMAFDHIVTKRGIEKIKTIGDAYMCAGGLPVPASSTPAGVVQAALEMQAFMIARKVDRDAQDKPSFEMRVGIHTGPVVAGIVGVKKFQYDIWGDTVNIASRMESSGEVGQVNISEATYALVKAEHGLTFTPRGKVQAKGKGEMEMYFVTTA
ncbi:MAG: adenylate/guanylate cyclase domain-containing protein [Flavobacteriales bacterium]|nr:adenylate/guanylate cyclase domain-containing protein [Flavobacteriales bacterium]